MRKLSWIIGLVLIAVVVATGYLLWPRPSPREILERMVSQFQNAQTIQVDTVYTLEFPMLFDILGVMAEGGDSELGDRLQVVYQSPRRVSCVLGNEEDPIYERVCDGQNLYVRTPLINNAFKSPLPKDMDEEAFVKEFVSGPGCGIDLVAFSEEGFNLAQIKSVQAGLPRDNDWFASLAQPQGTWVLTVTTENEAISPFVLWVDRHSYLPRQAAVQVSSEWWEGEGDRPSPEQVYTQVLSTHVIVYGRVSIDRPIPEDAFAFYCPEDVEIIEVESLKDMDKAMREAILNTSGPSSDSEPSD